MRALRAIGITFIFVLTALCVVAQTPPQAAESPEASRPPSTGSITGQVVDQNGQPLKGVTIEISARGTRGETVSTDREGQFVINGVQPADYYLSATLPSYLPDYAKWPRTPVRVGDRVTLTMIKGGVVTGKVIDASGDPVVTVPVRVLMVRDAIGRAVTNGWGLRTGLTDDRGIYRIYGLLAGTYVVYAGGSGRTGPMSSETVFGFDVPTYAPSSTRETAAEIDVRLGEEVTDVDIRYSGEQGRSISGDVAVPASSHLGFAVSLTAVGRTETLFAETAREADNKRTFVFSGVADGEYTLIAQSYSPESEIAVSEAKQVTVQGTDVTGIHLTTKLFGSVSGRVVEEELKLAECTDKEHPLTSETSVRALPRNDEAAKQIPQFIRSRSEPSRPDEQGNFVLRNLAPGAYYFDPILRVRQWYVHSITFGPTANATPKAKQVDAARVWTNVNNGDRLSGLTITLAQGGATLTGEYGLAQGEQVALGSFLYLVPAEREKATDVLRFFATPIARNGRFELNNIAPGRYWILAQMTGEDSAAQAAKVRLPHETETRAQLRREAEAAKIEVEFKPCQNILDFKLPRKAREQ